MNNVTRLLALFSMGLLVITGITGCDSIVPGSNEIGTDTLPVGGSDNATSKAYTLPALAAFNPATFTDENGGTWMLQFTSNNVSGSNTRFSYVLTKPDDQECAECDAPPEDIEFSYIIPECASYVGGSASPAPTSMSGDTLKWTSDTFSEGANPLSLDFVTPTGQTFERIGIVATGLRDEGASSPTIEYAPGPCNGVFDLEGTVFLNDTSDEDVPLNDDQDPGEPGMSDVELAVQEFVGGVWAFDDSPRKLTDTNGDYKFSVIGAPVPGMPAMYRVVITKTSTLGGAINESLFGGIFVPSCDDDCPDESDSSQISKEANLGNLMDLDFGFDVDLEGAVAKFDAGALFADGYPRKYWYRQNRQRGNGNFPLDYSKGEFLDILNCSKPSFDPPGPIECILDPNGNDNDFLGSDDSMIDQILPIDGNHDLKDTKLLLKKVPGSKLSKGRPSNNRDKYLTLQKELQQQILLGLLNYTVGRGVCKGDLGADGRCMEFDEPAMRVLIQNAIIVLVQSDFSVVGKASSGKVGSNSELLSRTN